MVERGEWAVACKAGELPEGGRLALSIAGQPVLLVRRGDRVHALLNRCPHLGCPLTRGTLDGFWLACPCHDWRFDIRTGAFEHASEIHLPTFETIVEAGLIHVRA